MNLSRSLGALLLLAGAAARAGAGITVDGRDADWAGTTTCFPEVAGDFNKVCLENDDGNSLFLLMEAATPFPSQQTIAYGYGLDHNNNGKLDQGDSYWDVVFPATGDKQPLSTDPIRLEHWVHAQLVASYLPGLGCGGTAGSNGWSAKRTEQAMELAISYGCLGLSSRTERPGVPGGRLSQLR